MTKTRNIFILSFLYAVLMISAENEQKAENSKTNEPDIEWYKAELDRNQQNLDEASSRIETINRQLKGCHFERTSHLIKLHDNEQSIKGFKAKINQTLTEIQELNRSSKLFQDKLTTCEKSFHDLSAELMNMNDIQVDKTKYKECIARMHKATYDRDRCDLENNFRFNKIQLLEQKVNSFKEEIQSLALKGGCEPNMLEELTQCRIDKANTMKTRDDMIMQQGKLKKELLECKKLNMSENLQNDEISEGAQNDKYSESAQNDKNSESAQNDEIGYLVYFHKYAELLHSKLPLILTVMFNLSLFLNIVLFIKLSNRKTSHRNQIEKAKKKQ